MNTKDQKITTWISGARAAEIIGISKSTVYRSLIDPERRARIWGTEHDGWRYKPLSVRRDYQVSQDVASQIRDGKRSTS